MKINQPIWMNLREESRCSSIGNDTIQLVTELEKPPLVTGNGIFTLAMVMVTGGWCEIFAEPILWVYRVFCKQQRQQQQPSGSGKCDFSEFL